MLLGRHQANIETLTTERARASVQGGGSQAIRPAVIVKMLRVFTWMGHCIPTHQPARQSAKISTYFDNLGSCSRGSSSATVFSSVKSSGPHTVAGTNAPTVPRPSSVRPQPAPSIVRPCPVYAAVPSVRGRTRSLTIQFAKALVPIRINRGRKSRWPAPRSILPRVWLRPAA